MTECNLGPGVTAETRASDEYCDLKDAIEAYREADDLPPQDDLWRVLGNLLAADLRDGFDNRAGVDHPADTPCVRRIITGEDECTCAKTRSWIDRSLSRVVLDMTGLSSSAM